MTDPSNDARPEPIWLAAYGGMTGDTLEIIHRDDQFMIEIDQPWYGDSVGGFGQTSHATLDRATAESLRDWLVARLQPSTEASRPALEKAARAVRALIIYTRHARNRKLAEQGLWPDANWMPTDTAIARAVLMAVREPDEAMKEAAENLWGDEIGVNYTQVDPEDFFTAMIDAILNEGT